jgi:hypothetical protein
LPIASPKWDVSPISVPAAVASALRGVLGSIALLAVTGWVTLTIVPAERLEGQRLMSRGADFVVLGTTQEGIKLVAEWVTITRRAGGR